MFGAISGWVLQSPALSQPSPRVEAPSTPSSPLPPQATPIPKPIAAIARSTTVRLLGTQAAGSGVMVHQNGAIHTVLTNWHVVSLSDRLPMLLTPDGQRHSLMRVRQVGQADLAIAQFRSGVSYPVAAIAPAVQVGESVYAAGFPMYRSGTVESTLALGIQNFQLTQGRLTVRLPKPLQQGYSLGYSNPVVVGMSGGPIFNAQGQLVGVNGRVKDRDPAFGSYVFEDGTEPDDALLTQITQSSFGIPVDLNLMQKF